MGSKMKDDEIGKACATYGWGKGGKKVCTGLWYRKLNRPTGRPMCR
jgi:hypothetical protein